ncbi:MAG: 3-deoxy-D-manno-octulosonic acid kinase [Nitrospiria bacterium]
MKPSYQKVGHHHILYDRSIIENPTPSLFDPQDWKRRGKTLGVAKGRGTTYFVVDHDRKYALRHYRRGGMIASLITDRYLWLGLSRSRAWQEWSLLNQMYSEGLPVPQPVAACVVREGCVYRADLMTLVLSDCCSLAEKLVSAPLTRVVWSTIGRCIRRFHLAGINHADLNARNILLNKNDKVFLIDFDKSARRTKKGKWQEVNLSRLRRSLNKLSKAGLFSPVPEENWKTLLEAYNHFKPETRK